MNLFQRRFLILSGKGGVGRTTVAAALARAAVQAGRRVLLAQMDSADRLARLLGHPRPIGPEIAAVAEGLDAVNMTAHDALHQYGLMVLKLESLYRVVFENRAMQSFLGAIPGLDAYAMLGKAWWHTTEAAGARTKYDLVILDGPASGHAVTMLKIPGAIIEAMPKGPLARDATAMQAMLADQAHAAFVIVTLPEELVARETVDLARTARDLLRLPLGPLIVNGVPPAVAPEIDPLLALLPTGDAALDATLAGAAMLRERRREAEEVLGRLRQDPGLPLVELPRLPSNDLGPAEVDQLADTLYSRLTSS